MLKIDLYNQNGEKRGQLEVPDHIFGLKPNKDLVQQALIRQLASRRLGMIAHTKTKGEVRGGGRKPYRQKGTGKARQGSIRNPHWIKGGVALGPRNNRNYVLRMPRKQRRLALFCALSMKMGEGRIFALDKYETESIKTKDFAEMLKKLPLQKNALFVIPEKNDHLQKSCRNLPSIKTLLVSYLNIADLQKYDCLVFLEEALKKIEKVFSISGENLKA